MRFTEADRLRYVLLLRGKNKVSISDLKERAELPDWWEQELARRDVLFFFV